MKKSDRATKTLPLARRELEFMNAIWDQGEATAQQVQEALEKQGPKLRESTVRTILRVLEEKGAIAHRVLGRTYVYRPRLDRAAMRSAVVRDTANRMFGGSLAALVRHILLEEKTTTAEKKSVRDAARSALR